MRVYDLAKELGKDSSKEILDILEKHNINLKSSSNVTDEQAAIVKKEVGGHNRGTAPVQSNSPDGDDSDAPKKKIAAVFRPQNAQMKPQGQHSQSQGGRSFQSDRQNGDSRNRQVSEQSLSGTSELKREQNTDNREGGRPQGGYQGNRDNREGRPQGGYQGNRDNREGRPQGGYQGNRDGRPQGQGGYQGNRDGRPQGQGG
ncbi:translation initiation factor IF-2 N-terminal domain-containing protein, partial [Lacrimispora sp.]|uniref:translation initiation factor IF-2 N-terminal domain-containing protein n=1 Tax=Lacrimispora sp. TaxID=2719234 RepID=UPI0028A158B2